MEKIENDYLSKVNLSIFPNFKEHTLTKLYFTQLTHCMTHIRSVNKTDVVTLASTFGVCKLCKLYNVKKLCYIYVDFINIQSLKDIMNATPEDISICPGIGEQKVTLKTIHFTMYDV